MKIIIADDEESARERLRGLLAEIDPAVRVVGEAGDGGEALRLVAELRPDVVLLDILMPRIDGLDAARQIARLPDPPAVVFVTAHNDHAVDAFEVSAIDYLLKPVRRQRLDAALGKARRFTGAEWHKLEANLPRECLPERTCLCVHQHGELRLIPLAAVAYFQADHKYTTVRHDAGEALLDESLVALEREFGERFVRVHRNALAAADRLAGLERLDDGRTGLRLLGVPDVLEVSRRHLATVRGRLRSLAKR